MNQTHMEQVSFHSVFEQALHTKTYPFLKENYQCNDFCSHFHMLTRQCKEQADL